MPLIASPVGLPIPAPTLTGPMPTPPPGTWSGWYSVGEMLDLGDVPAPAAPGAYAFRIRPSVGLVPRGCPTRLIDLGGMGSTGTLYNRVGTFIGAALGRLSTTAHGPAHAAGLNFASYRGRAHAAWSISVRDLDLAIVLAPPGYEHFCAEVSLWSWYLYTYASAVGTRARPWCCTNVRWTCSHRGGHAAHSWFQPPPEP